MVFFQQFRQTSSVFFFQKTKQKKGNKTYRMIPSLCVWLHTAESKLYYLIGIFINKNPSSLSKLFNQLKF